MVLKVILTLLIVLCVLLLTAYINHRIRSEKEKPLLEPLGQLVEVAGKNMCVYTQGEGENTIVFLSGGGTVCPTLDFKSLYSQLTDEYKIAVVEKFGYGFSDDHDRSRDIDTMLSDTREALSKAGLQGPYILCPHSMSGLEALYWAQQYPDEVAAIVGLDMALPEYYAHMDISSALSSVKLTRVLGEMGLMRLIAGSVINTQYAESSLTENDKKIITALYSKRCYSETCLNEVNFIQKNAQMVDRGGLPGVPVLMFISNGELINLDPALWVNTARDYASQLENGMTIQLDCSHMLHNIEYRRIAEEMKTFLATLDLSD